MFYSRDIKFDLDPAQIHTYLKLGRHGTDYMNALSLLFPVGEKFFIDAVRKYEHLAGEQLQAEIKEFYKQEARHTREHIRLNNILRDEGVNIAEIDARIKIEIDLYVKGDPKRALILTICLEKFTEMLAKILIRFKDRITRAGAYGDLLFWHAGEEVEHVHVTEELGKLIGINRWHIAAAMPRIMLILQKQIALNYLAIKNVSYR